MQNSEPSRNDSPESPTRRFVFKQDMQIKLEQLELPPKHSEVKDRLFNHIPLIKTKKYKESLAHIIQDLGVLQEFGSNIQSKVDRLLEQQEKEFVESYKGHIHRITSEHKNLSLQINALEEKVNYYENDGEMSKLVGKVFKLEKESARLFELIKDKDHRIRDLDLMVKVQKEEIRRMHQDAKKHFRKNHDQTLDFQLSRDEAQEQKSNHIFPTELNQAKHLPKNTQQISTVDLNHSPLNFFSKNFSLKSMNNEESLQKLGEALKEKMTKENSKLRIKNKKLVSFQSEVLYQKQTMEEFFIKMVEELKREIKSRKRINQCSFEDFRKEDKLTLMIKVLSNDQILAYLHQRIFHNHETPHQEKQDFKPLESKKRMSFGGASRLPKLSFNLNYS